jgi:hypothetical protein
MTTYLRLRDCRADRVIGDPVLEPVPVDNQGTTFSDRIGGTSVSFRPRQLGQSENVRGNRELASPHGQPATLDGIAVRMEGTSALRASAAGPFGGPAAAMGYGRSGRPPLQDCPHSVLGCLLWARRWGPWRAGLASHSTSSVTSTLLPCDVSRNPSDVKAKPRRYVAAGRHVAEVPRSMNEGEHLHFFVRRGRAVLLSILGLPMEPRGITEK